MFKSKTKYTWEGWDSSGREDWVLNYPKFDGKEKFDYTKIGNIQILEDWKNVSNWF